MLSRSFGNPWERLEARLDKSGDCWVFLGAKDKDGYGKVFSGLQGVWLRAHRVSWTRHKGTIPTGSLVLHTCDNPPCCNPDHLFLGTNMDNTRDMLAKGRGRWAAT